MHPAPDMTALRTDRREWLRSGMFGLCGAALASAGARPLAAADPPARNGKSHLKLSLAAYSFRQALTAKPPAMTLEQFIEYCAAQNLDGCELTSYYFPKEITRGYLLRLKELTFRLGLDVSGTAIGNNFCVPPGPEREKQLALTRQWIDYAAEFGAPVIRIFAGSVANGSSEAEALELCIAGINESLDYAAEKGVFLALENHGGITATADQLLAIVRGVKSSPWFGVNLDSGNFRTADPYGDLARIAPYAVNAQIKTEISPNGRKEEADLARIVSILRAANYRGYVVLEYEAEEAAETAVPRHLAALRKLITPSPA